MVRTIVDIISSGALPPKKGTANGVSACLFFWALAHFSEQLIAFQAVYGLGCQF